MYDPGNAYLVGFAFSFIVAAITMLFAKKALDKRGEKTPLTMAHIRYTATAGAVLVAAGITKITVFAEFYATHSMYNPV
ncbi:MAG: hypothetical protein COB46_04875 [Rhodospirillaceae bacterium]|nr:MAG: hypothetical protein COB46_04875 [Rhodospirillaceae bacterium]